jgi:hypothetical protein
MPRPFFVIQSCPLTFFHIWLYVNVLHTLDTHERIYAPGIIYISTGSAGTCALHYWYTTTNLLKQLLPQRQCRRFLRNQITRRHIPKDRKLNTVLRDNIKPYTTAICSRHVDYSKCQEIQVPPQVFGPFVSFLVNLLMKLLHYIWHSVLSYRNISFKIMLC